MPSPHCYGSLQVCALRVAALDASGAPLPGASNGYVSDSLIQASVSLELETGDDFTLKNGCGAICQTFRDCDRIKRAAVDLELCTLDSELIALLIGAGTLFTDTGTGDAIGYELPSSAIDCPDGVSLELWTKAWDGASQAAAPFLGAPSYYHFVFPKVRWQMGDLTMENEIMSIPLTGIADENPGMDADGPFDDWNADIILAGGFTTVGGWFLDDTLPTAACGYIAVP
jgi:hypothetical protein